MLWDGKENASAVVVAMLQHLVPAVNDILRKDSDSAEYVLQQLRHNMSDIDLSVRRLAKISWVLSDGHPLRLWLLAHELAVPAPETSLYDGNGSW